MYDIKNLNWKEYDFNDFNLKNNGREYEKKEGVYLLCFPNGKYYVGKSIDLYHRISTHCRNLLKPRNDEWYETAAKENNISGSKWYEVLNQIEVIYAFCDKSGVYEALILAKLYWDSEKWEQYYNTDKGFVAKNF